jgi:hypothetical protein
VPEKYVKKLGGRNLKVIGSIQDLFTITSYQGFSPQGNSYGDNNLIRGIDNGLYPASKTFKFGFQMTF